MYEFLSIILIVFGVLQIILFFKMWGMTNDVDKIKNKLLSSNDDNKVIIDAQIKALDGKVKEAFDLYKQAFFLNVIELYNQTIEQYGGEDDLSNKEKNDYWETQFSRTAKYFIKKVNKLGEYKLDVDKYNTYEKVHSFINKL